MNLRLVPPVSDGTRSLGGNYTVETRRQWGPEDEDPTGPDRGVRDPWVSVPVTAVTVPKGRRQWRCRP